MTPISTAPIGVEPTNNVVHNAVTRPRISGGAASWMVLLPVVRKAMLAAPTSTAASTAVCAEGLMASSAIATA